MNILGHSYIATKVVTGRRDLLIIGSLLPESFPFIEGNPFTFEEIHEGGRKLFDFLNRNYPEEQDLALGILAHSAELGADGFNKEIEEYAGDQKEELLREIAICSGVDLKIAEYRLHNFLWAGVDLWILRKYPEFVRKVQSIIRAVDAEGISALLAEAFGKEPAVVEKVVRMLFGEIFRPGDLTSVEGLARNWARQAAGLPEKDRVDVSRAVEVVEECARLLKNDWGNIVGLVETKVGENLWPLIERGARRKSKEQ